MCVMTPDYLQVNDARKFGEAISIVTPDWLWSCSERWERVSEELFTLTKTCPVTRKPPAHCSSPEIAFAQRYLSRILLSCNPFHVPDVPTLISTLMVTCSADSQV